MHSPPIGDVLGKPLPLIAQHLAAQREAEHHAEGGAAAATNRLEEKRRQGRPVEWRGAVGEGAPWDCTSLPNAAPNAAASAPLMDRKGDAFARESALDIGEGLKYTLEVPSERRSSSVPVRCSFELGCAGRPRGHPRGHSTNTAYSAHIIECNGQGCFLIRPRQMSPLGRKRCSSSTPCDLHLGCAPPLDTRIHQAGWRELRHITWETIGLRGLFRPTLAVQCRAGQDCSSY